MALLLLCQAFPAVARQVPVQRHKGAAQAHRDSTVAPAAPLTFDMSVEPRAGPRAPPIGEDKAVHLGAITITPGGFLAIGTGGPAGCD